MPGPVLDTDNTEKREALEGPTVLDTGNFNTDNQDQLVQSERNGHFHLKVQEELSRQGLWFIS